MNVSTMRAAGGTAPLPGQFRPGLAAPAARVVGRPVGSGVGCTLSRFPDFTAARCARAWSQLAVALRVGVTRQAVAEWERHSIRPSEDTLDALAEAFRVERLTVERWFGLEFVPGGRHAE